MAAASRKEEERNERIVRGLLKLPPNRRCINCDGLVRVSSTLAAALSSRAIRGSVCLLAAASDLGVVLAVLLNSLFVCVWL